MSDQSSFTDLSTSEATDVVNEYLTAFYAGEHEAARRLVSEDFAFRGPFLEVAGAKAFFDGAAGLRTMVRGHRPLGQWQRGRDVSTLYEVELKTPTAAGSVLMSERNLVSEGRVTSGLVVFDTAAFRALVPQAGAGAS